MRRANNTPMTSKRTFVTRWVRREAHCKCGKCVCGKCGKCGNGKCKSFAVSSNRDDLLSTTFTSNSRSNNHGLLTLPMRNMRSRGASVCTKQIVRAVHQVTRPVSQTRHIAGLRGHASLVTGCQGFTNSVTDAYAHLSRLQGTSSSSLTGVASCPRHVTVWWGVLGT